VGRGGRRTLAVRNFGPLDAIEARHQLSLEDAARESLIADGTGVTGTAPSLARRRQEQRIARRRARRPFRFFDEPDPPSPPSPQLCLPGFEPPPVVLSYVGPTTYTAPMGWQSYWFTEPYVVERPTYLGIVRSVD
jgi:hypothetical protein